MAENKSKKKSLEIRTGWEQRTSERINLGFSNNEGLPITAKCGACGWYSCRQDVVALQTAIERHELGHYRSHPRIEEGISLIPPHSKAQKKAWAEAKRIATDIADRMRIFKILLAGGNPYGKTEEVPA